MISGWTQGNHNGAYKRKREARRVKEDGMMEAGVRQNDRPEDTSLLALKVEEEAINQRMLVAYGS